VRIGFLLISLIAKTAFAGWYEYPIHADFGSQQLCTTAAESLDSSPSRSDADLSITCKEGKLTGTILANPKLSSVTLQIVWPAGITIECDQLMKHFQDSAAVTQLDCEKTKKIPLIPKSLSSQWVATFSFPLQGGKDIDVLQQERIASGEKQEKLREQLEDERSCNEALTHPGMFDKFLAHFFGRPCQWMQNTGAGSPVSNVTVPGKETQPVGGTGSDTSNGQQTTSGNLLSH
jgi:hypothetical protein